MADVVPHLIEWASTFQGVSLDARDDDADADLLGALLDALPAVWADIAGPDYAVDGLATRGSSWVTRKQNLGRLLFAMKRYYAGELSKRFDYLTATSGGGGGGGGGVGAAFAEI